jgi:hypothetical protein
MVGLYDPFAPSGVPTADDLALAREAGLERMRGGIPALDPSMTAMPQAPQRRSPRVMFNPTTGQMSAGGVVFDQRDIGTLTRVPELLANPQGEDPTELGWEPLSLGEVQLYLEASASAAVFWVTSGWSTGCSRRAYQWYWPTGRYAGC